VLAHADPTDKFSASWGKQEMLTRFESSLRWLDAGQTSKLFRPVLASKKC
jgi:hypothetical protein